MKDASKNFEILRYANGTHTLVDADNQQAMHSVIGPLAEADLVYAGRARIEKKLSSDNSRIVLYDIGMGTAANVVATLNRIKRSPKSRGTLTIASFETKPEGLATVLENLELFPDLHAWKTPLRELLRSGETLFEVGDVNIDWRLHTGDFYACLKNAPSPDVLYFDFYSPKVVPELWSLESFKKIRTQIGDQPALLYTYAAATPVRLHLLAAGFFVGEGGKTAVKRETTIASTRLESLESPLPRSWLRKLETSASIAGQPFASARLAASENPQWNGLPPVF
jgi:tRNA U34 5-methylaminomethyl-2-thiouridine-forming methyltransferase MnmC